jgi:hypothetical protein
MSRRGKHLLSRTWSLAYRNCSYSRNTMLIRVQRNFCMFMHSRSQGKEKKSMRSRYRDRMCPGLSHRKRDRIILCCITTTNKINAFTSMADPHWARFRSPLVDIVEYVTDCNADVSSVKWHPRYSAFVHMCLVPSTDEARSTSHGTDHGLEVYVIRAYEWPRSSIVLPTCVAQNRNVTSPAEGE